MEFGYTWKLCLKFANECYYEHSESCFYVRWKLGNMIINVMGDKSLGMKWWNENLRLHLERCWIIFSGSKLNHAK